MPRNDSVERFKRVLAKIPVEAERAINAEIEKQASRIAGAIATKAPVGDTGNLRRSVRYRMGRLRASIIAGGQPTEKRSSGGIASSFIQGFRDGLRGRRTRRAAKSGAYDYAMANEFGTQKMKAQPFFFPTWRRYRGGAGKAIKAAAKRAIVNVR